jgi:hypothetical protein
VLSVFLVEDSLDGDESLFDSPDGAEGAELPGLRESVA